MPTLALLDGHSLAYRAFYALPEDLRTSAGQQTNAAYGFARMLVKLLADHTPDRLAVAWDVGRQTFRTEAYPEYKAQRAASPEGFTGQLPLIDGMLGAMGITQLRHEGYEADDVIASLATRAESEGWEVVVVTGDRDAFQLVDGRVRVLYTRRGISDVVEADPAWVEERYGVAPAAYLDYAALRGDPSDNLPGVPGVGEKTAAKLVATFGSLEGIYDHLGSHSPKLAENLTTHRDQVFLNRSLMTMVRDLDVPGVDELRWDVWDESALRSHLESLEFHSLFAELSAVHPTVPSLAASPALEATTTTATSVEAVVAAVAANPLVLAPVMDLGDLVGIVVVDPGGAPVFVPTERLDAAAPVLSDPAHPKIGHHLKPLVRSLLDLGIPMAGLAFDTALAAHLLNPATRDLDLATLAERRLGLSVADDDADRRGGAQGAFDLDDGPDLDAIGVAVLTIVQLADSLAQEVDDRNARRVLEDLELPLIPILAGMEQEGIGVDRAYLEQLGTEIRDRLSTLEHRIHDAAGGPFNINSTLQLRELLFDRLGLPVLKKTAKGVPSTDASVLAKLADGHPVVAMLLDYRELEKLRSTYVEGYLPLIADDGRIHTTFNQFGSATGRLSSDHPNLQNIPVRSETGLTVRQAFVARPGWRFVVADYSQIELRILAHMSGDDGLVDAFRSGLDIHTATASSVFDLDPSAVGPEHRRRAKAINFGLLYGMEAFGLAERLGITRDEAKDHIDAYFARFPSVASFMEGIVDQARRDGYTETIFGRRRYLPELVSDNFRVRQMGERMALNAPIQGSAADIIKLAMVAVDARLVDHEAVQLLQIHDELVLEAPAGLVDETELLVRSTMESVVDLAVPLSVDTATGANLAETKG